MNPTRPGYLTTEFWMVVVTQLIALVTLFAPNLGAKIDTKWVQPVAVAAAAISGFVYAHVRGKVKAAAVHPLAYAPVPKGMPPELPSTLAFHSGVAGVVDEPTPEYTPVSDDEHAAALKAHAAKRPARRRT